MEILQHSCRHITENTCVLSRLSNEQDVLETYTIETYTRPQFECMYNTSHFPPSNIAFARETRRKAPPPFSCFLLFFTMVAPPFRL